MTPSGPTARSASTAASSATTLVVEGEERPLRRWDIFHCPPGVAHAIVGAGARSGAKGLVYPVDPAGGKHGASVSVETTEPKVAYEGIDFRDGPCKEGWLPD